MRDKFSQVFVVVVSRSILDWSVKNQQLRKKSTTVKFSACQDKTKSEMFSKLFVSLFGQNDKQPQLLEVV